jgi:hypothetical protein
MSLLLIEYYLMDPFESSNENLLREEPNYVHRRRLQNRLAQRRYRESIK